MIWEVLFLFRVRFRFFLLASIIWGKLFWFLNCLRACSPQMTTFPNGGKKIEFFLSNEFITNGWLRTKVSAHRRKVWFCNIFLSKIRVFKKLKYFIERHQLPSTDFNLLLTTLASDVSLFFRKVSLSRYLFYSNCSATFDWSVVGCSHLIALSYKRRRTVL